VAAEGAQEFPGSDRRLRIRWRKSKTVTFRPQSVHHRAGQNGGVDVGALEPLVPVPLVVKDPARPHTPATAASAVDTQTIETKRIQFQTCTEAEAFQDVRFGFIG